ncbi:MAG: putative copper-containig nitrite reductase [Nitrosopumilales archaeon]|nr:MAG: putative copper-containig nitrite reductase [Nitrosopumilales archaeon]
MNKRYSMIFTIAAVAVIGVTLFGSTYTQTQITGQTLDVTKMDVDMIQKIHDMGGLRLVMPQAFAETDCGVLEASGRNVVEFNVTGESVEMPYLGGTFNAMTFSQQIPGPTLRVTQGDVVKMTLTIPAGEFRGHGNDMHASQISSLNFDSINPGESKTFCYIAETAGVFKYHCSGVHLIGMDEHVLSGMYGIAIVDPVKGYKKLMVEKTSGSGVLDRQFYSADALEFHLQYNQLYLTEDGNYDQTAMFGHQNTATVVNGQQFGYFPNMVHNLLVLGDPDTNIVKVIQPWNGLDLKQYQSQPLYVETGQHVRFFVENQGNEPVFWHIVGEIIDRVTQGNRVQSAATETWLLGGSQNMIADVVFDEPGVYLIVNHDYAAIYTGAVTVVVAGDPFGLNPRLVDAGVIPAPVPSYAYALGNPSDAVPPMGKNSIAHPALNVHGMYTDDVAADKIAEGALPLWEIVPTLPPI